MDERVPIQLVESVGEAERLDWAEVLRADTLDPGGAASCEGKFFKSWAAELSAVRKYPPSPARSDGCSRAHMKSASISAEMNPHRANSQANRGRKSSAATVSPQVRAAWL